MKKNTRNSLADYIADNQYRYYYANLSNNVQNAYDKLLKGYMKHTDSIMIRVSSMDEAWLIHQSLCCDVPEVFFVKSVKGSYNPLLSTATVYPEYRFDYETCFNILRQMEKRTKAFIQRIAMLSEWERVKQIHDFITRNVTYRDVEAPYSHESPGVLLYGIAVCEGIAKAFKYLSDRARINSLVITGDAFDDSNQSSNATGHAWNIVFVDSTPYHIDVTFDYSVSSGAISRYDYFLLSDSQIRKDHTFEGTPECTNDYEFYITNGHYADSKKALQVLVKNELRFGKPLVVKTPDFLESADRVTEKLIATVTAAVPLSYGLNSSISLSYNRSRMIYQFELCR